MKAPVIYIPNFLDNPSQDFDYFTNIKWDDRTSARREAFFSTTSDPYTYGDGDYARTYVPQIMDPRVYSIGTQIASVIAIPPYDLCFLNYYQEARRALGWHSDDSGSIDHDYPIAVISLGAERELWVKPIGGDNTTVEKILLENGSLFLMGAGMQQTHLHRIPKHNRPCGPRISLTYRALKY